MKRILAVASLLFLARAAFAAGDLSFKKEKEISVPGGLGFDLVSVDPASRRMLVAHATKIEVIDLDKGTKVGEVAGVEGAHEAVIVPGSKRGFATAGKKNKVIVFDAETYKVAKEIETGDGPDALLYVAATKEVWVINHKAGTVTCVDAESLEVKATIDVGGKLELAAEYAAKGRIFVNVEDKNQTAAIDAKTHAVVARYPLDPATEPTGVAVDEKNGLVFCGCSEKLAVLDAETGKVLSVLPIGKRCDSVAFDAERSLVFASCGDGTTAVIRRTDPKTFEVAATIETAPGGKTCALDPKTHTLWVCAGTRGKDDLRLLAFSAGAKK